MKNFLNNKTNNIKIFFQILLIGVFLTSFFYFNDYYSLLGIVLVFIFEALNKYYNKNQKFILSLKIISLITICFISMLPGSTLIVLLLPILFFDIFRFFHKKILNHVYKKTSVALPIFKLFLGLLIGNIILIVVLSAVIDNIYIFESEIIRDVCYDANDCWYKVKSSLTGVFYLFISSFCLVIVSILCVKKRNFYNKANIVVLFFVVCFLVYLTAVTVIENVDYTKKGFNSGYIDCLEDNFRFSRDPVDRSYFCNSKFKNMDLYENNLFYILMKNDIKFVTDNTEYTKFVDGSRLHRYKSTYVDYQYRQDGTLEKEVHHDQSSNEKLFEKIFDKDGKYVEDWVLYFDMDYFLKEGNNRPS